MASMASVRESLGLAGQSASFRQLAREAGAALPLSLREFTGAPPVGAIQHKVIPLVLLRRKIDEFINLRNRPPFRIRLNGTHYGASTVTVTFDDAVKGYDHDPFITAELAKPGEVLEFDGILYGTHRFYFRDFNSDGLSLEMVERNPVLLQLDLHFETTGDAEVSAETFPDIDFTHFSISIKFELGLDRARAHHRLGLTPAWIQADVSVDVSALPDGKVAAKIEGTLNSKIYAALKDNLGVVSPMLTAWLIGGDFYVVAATSDGQSLLVDYIVPPGQLEPFPQQPQDPLDPGALANIDHIVVLMMENRSFDHMLGYLSKEGGGDGRRRADINGLTGTEANPYAGRSHSSFALSDTRFDESPGHGYEEVKAQLNGVAMDGNFAMDGFVTNFAIKYAGQDVDPGRIMGYHTAVRVPVYDALAREFMVCDHWFAAHPGPTFCNRFYTLTGRLNRNPQGGWETDNPPLSELAQVSTKTIFDHLTDRAVSWRYYERGYCFLRMFARYATDTMSIVDAGNDSANFVASALAGDLSSVTFIDPDFIDYPPGYDDGAPADIARGQHFIGRVVDALVRGPLWKKTLLVVTYDEHGGFYDHVSPPAAVPVSGIDRYGVRVPTFVISPWVDMGSVSKIVFDHTSIAKTIARRFMSAHPPDMGERMARANDLSAVLRTTGRPELPSIPIPPDPTPDAAVRQVQAQAHAQEDDFKDLLLAMRERHPVPR